MPVVTIMQLLNLLVLLCSFAIASSALAAGIKKWVDDQGMVHYGSSIPPEYVNKEHSELNDRGIEVERVDRAKTPEEIAQQKELERLRREQQKIEAEQRAKDRVLLSMFRTEDDLIMVRDGKLAQIHSQVELKQKQIERLKTRLSKWLASAAASERRGNSLSTALKENLESTKSQIESGYAYILDKEEDKQQIAESYNRDLQRFRQLQSLHPDRLSRGDNRLVIPDVEGAFLCDNLAHCERLWPQAVVYAEQHANTPVELNGQRILMTHRARAPQDISITVSRLSTRGLERIFLDIQCQATLAGRELCGSEKVSMIRREFGDFLKSR